MGRFWRENITRRAAVYVLRSLDRARRLPAVQIVRDCVFVDASWFRSSARAARQPSRFGEVQAVPRCLSAARAIEFCGNAREASPRLLLDSQIVASGIGR